MIPIERSELDSALAARLAERSLQLASVNATPSVARQKWRSARSERSSLRQQLGLMAPSLQRCMYCSDNLGTDIDHFEPIIRTPLRTFDWLNHLLACSYCNSNQKRAAFPCDAAGESLLIDPTRDDPSHPLRLALTTGEYRALTSKGAATIQVFGLNRADLVRGRANAFSIRQAVLCRARDLLGLGREAEAARCLTALTEEPHATVLWAMITSMGKPGAHDVLGRDVVAALEDPTVRASLNQRILTRVGDAG
jgi:uncharacterized protein (TIGR02646 family)